MPGGASLTPAGLAAAQRSGGTLTNTKPVLWQMKNWKYIQVYARYIQDIQDIPDKYEIPIQAWVGPTRVVCLHTYNFCITTWYVDAFVCIEGETFGFCLTTLYVWFLCFSTSCFGPGPGPGDVTNLPLLKDQESGGCFPILLGIFYKMYVNLHDS